MAIKPKDAKAGDDVTVGEVDITPSEDKKQLSYAEASVTQVTYERAPILERKQRLLQELEAIAKHKTKTETDLAACNKIIADMDAQGIV